MMVTPLVPMFSWCLGWQVDPKTASRHQELSADLAPDSSEVLFADLAVSPERQSVLELVGYLLIFLIFWCFMPVVVFIQSIANLSTLQEDRVDHGSSRVGSCEKV